MTDTSAALQAPQQTAQPQNVKRLLTPFGCVRGNLTADPELRYTQDQKPVVNITIASTERVRQANGEYVDGPTTFYRGTAWNALAEHVAASLTKGQSVLAFGPVHLRDYVNGQGQPGTSVDLDIREIGPSLRWGTTVFTKSGQQAPAQQGQFQHQQQAAPQGQYQQQPPAQQGQFQPQPQAAPQGQFQQQPQAAPQGQFQQQPQQQQQQAAPQGQPAFQFQNGQPAAQVAQVGAGNASEVVF